MKKLLVSLLMVVVGLGALAVQKAAAGSPLRAWQAFSPAAPVPSFIIPVAMAADRYGRLFVADLALDQVQKLSPSGAQLQVFGSLGWRPGHLHAPTTVGLDQWGNIYVLDSGNQRIQVFSPRGLPKAAIALPQGGYAGGMAVDPWGNIYLSFYNSIQKLSPRGVLLGAWHRNVSSSLAADGSGNVYFTAYGRHGADTGYYPYIYKLSPQGRTTFRGRYTGGYLQSIAVGTSGVLYLLDSGAGRISELAADGTIVAQVAVPRRWQYGGPSTLTVDGAGDIFLAYPQNHQVIKLSPGGAVLGVWGMRVRTPRRFRLPGGVATDVHGNLYVADTWNDRVQELSPSGAFIRHWGGRGRLPGRFDLPTDVLVDRQGDVVVADLGNSRLEVFTPTGRLVRTVPVPGPHYVYRYQPYFPYYGPGALRIALDRQGNYIVADTSNNRVELLSPTGRILRAYFQWVTRRESAAAGVAADASGNVYVTDGGAARIVKLSPTGQRLAVWGQFGYVGLGNFNRPAGIAIDAAGNVYVSDVSNHRIQELSPAGRPLRAWGILGAAPGQFAYPQGIAVSNTGTVYVADTWNNRIQRLTT